MKRVMLIAGARPNFMKISPIMRSLSDVGWNDSILVHTGQHYDDKLSKVFFDDLNIPVPKYNLGVGSGSHGEQTGSIMIKFEPILMNERPDWVVVVGDVNSTLACSIVASKLHYPIAHVEAGLRSRNRQMPEEINRILTDRISDILFTTSEDANINLLSEGIERDKIHYVGNTMIDSLIYNLKIAEKSMILEQLSLTKNDYAVLTLHRPANVDDKDVLIKVMDIIKMVSSKIDVVYPIHPRTLDALYRYALYEDAKSISGLRIMEPLGYLDFLKLISNSKMLLTDSGGIQEEATYLNTPCLTMREETERPITVEQGSNTIVGLDFEKIKNTIAMIINGEYKKASIPELWDGKASERIVSVLQKCQL